MIKTLAKLTFIATALFGGSALAEPDAKATYQDIQSTLGLVPSFFKAFPEEGVAAAWDELKSIQLNPKTALSMKQKELIGLAVAAQVPCRYCVYFHTQVGKQLGGASDAEVKEAVAMAAITRHWSTVLNGLQIDMGEFKQELAGVVGFFKAGKSKPNTIEVTNAASAYKDMEATLGRVPTFFRKFPEVGVAAAWREFKRVQLNPATKLDGKTKELIALGVAAQIPCGYCIAFHTEAALLNGANDAEIREAVAMAAITRHWSTVLNGAMPDETQFRKEVDQIISNAKKTAKR
jgi:AhpD family alkylhydroperoxidase